jgi:hypothetical protein
MLGRHTRTDDEIELAKGTSLAKGPALVVGSILFAFGLIGMVVNSEFPPRSGFPDAAVSGDALLGVEVNGWTNFLLVACGGLLLFGAAQHLLAKTMSLITGAGLGAAAIFAAIRGEILGLGAANRGTVIAMAIAAGALLLNALMPRVGRRERVATDGGADGEPAEPVARTGHFQRRDTPAREDREPVGATSTTHPEKPLLP